MGEVDGRAASMGFVPTLKDSEPAVAFSRCRYGHAAAVALTSQSMHSLKCFWNRRIWSAFF
jgi:hypothetical protein